jgi:hypothetical protein
MSLTGEVSAYGCGFQGADGILLLDLLMARPSASSSIDCPRSPLATAPIVRAISVVGRTKSSSSVFKELTVVAKPPIAPGNDMRCFSLPSLLKRIISWATRSSFLRAWLKAPAIRPSVPDNLKRLRGSGVPLMDAVVVGASERLRPVLMTATVATVGMLPAALATGVGSDVQRSLATVVTGGLVLATLLTLFLLPTFYFVMERIVERREGVDTVEFSA